jgi:hypothetical protein
VEIRKSGGGLVEPDYNWFDSDDPTARARVGPNPQIQVLNNLIKFFFILCVKLLP